MGKGTHYLGNLVPLLGTLNRTASLSSPCFCQNAANMGNTIGAWVNNERGTAVFVVYIFLILFLSSLSRACVCHVLARVYQHSCQRHDVIISGRRVQKIWIQIINLEIFPFVLCLAEIFDFT